MADKKRRLEQDPSLDPKTGKKRERRLKDDRIRVDVKIDGLDIPGFTKADLERARRAAEKFGESSMGGIFGGGQKASGGGRINIEGSDGRARPWPGGGYDSSRLMGGLMDFINQYSVPRHMMGMGEEVNFRDAVARMLHTKAIECWDSLMGWQFACTFNEGQETFWFTARYYDDEAGEPLVTETLEFSEEVLAKRNWDETHLEVERQMEKMHEKCIADLAMFDD